METQLDLISEHQSSEQAMLKEFYDKFAPLIDNALAKMEKTSAPLIDELCPLCGSPLALRSSKYGKFLGCSNFPKCKYIQKDEEDVPQLTDKLCPDCGKPMILRNSRRGQFYGCSGFPKCRKIINLDSEKSDS
jgi:DNA topoisomerase-1